MVLETPALGCILVFWRGSTTGPPDHVELYAGEDARCYLHVLGSNQPEATTIAWLDKAGLPGMRWPTSYPKPRGGKVMLSAAGAPILINEAQFGRKSSSSSLGHLVGIRFLTAEGGVSATAERWRIAVKGHIL